MRTAFDPGRYRAGTESIGHKRRALEGGGFDREMTVPADEVIHAEWTHGFPRRPPLRLYATASHEHHEAWCGTRLRLILPEPFDPGSVRACPACLDAFDRGYPAALIARN